MGLLKKAFFGFILLFAVGLELFRRKTAMPLHIEEQDLNGKVFIVTGTSSGIGKETALTLVQWGGKVVMGNRNTEKAQKTVEYIENKSGKKGMVENWKLDLASTASIHEFADKFKASGLPVNALVNNAGMVVNDDVIRFTKDGYEQTIGTNYYGPFLLTHLLMDNLKASAPSRVVNVASEGYMMGKIDLSDIEQHNQVGFWRYCNTKLMNIMHATELNRRLVASGTTDVVVTSLHPGMIWTPIFKDGVVGTFPEWFRDLIDNLMMGFGRTELDGAKTQIMLATDPKYGKQAGAGGLYFEDAAVHDLVNPQATDAELLKGLYDFTLKRLGLN